MLQVNDIAVAYGDVQAIWGVSIAVNEGEIVTLVGSNGAGKTTLLRAISNLNSIKSGTIYLDGERIDTLPAPKIALKGICHVPEGRRLFGSLTVLENLQTGSLGPRSKQKRGELLEEAFEMFPVLKERQHQLAWSLSGGEQQMLAIARALMGMPRLLMLDEPSLGLGPLVVQQIFDTVTAINARGVTVLLVEQNVEHALRIAHRGYVLENGRMVLEGSGEQLLRDEAVVKAYLGM